MLPLMMVKVASHHRTVDPAPSCRGRSGPGCAKRLDGSASRCRRWCPTDRSVGTSNRVAWHRDLV